MQKFYANFKGKRIFLTGHTGFKGAWLAHWLIRLGAQVTGYSLAAEAWQAPANAKDLYSELQLDRRMHSILGDVRDQLHLRDAIKECQPDFVFHLAAQALVRRSYRDPVGTYSSNVMGTIHVLESLRHLQKPCTAILVASDKCYENSEVQHAFQEQDRLGGVDPYSSSKAMSELAAEAYRRSWFSKSSYIRLASVRAGNVIGGGDWSEDRIIPDCIRSLASGQAISLRNPQASRPWQHVLEPLYGYLLLAGRLANANDPAVISQLSSAFNFGPDDRSNRSVDDLVEQVLNHWPGQKLVAEVNDAPHEAMQLRLSTRKAADLLDWRCIWEFPKTVELTIQWYKRVLHGECAMTVTDQQINYFETCHAQQT